MQGLFGSTKSLAAGTHKLEKKRMAHQDLQTRKIPENRTFNQNFYTISLWSKKKESIGKNLSTQKHKADRESHQKVYIIRKKRVCFERLLLSTPKQVFLFFISASLYVSATQFKPLATRIQRCCNDS